jgi:hypothetical protein
MRLEDREKKKLKENPPPPPEPPKNTCEKSLGRITVTCGDATGAKPADAKEEAKGKDDEASSLTSIVVKVLGAIATGIGVTGAVVVVGAAIFWARFDAIGLPATQAVTAIPRTELLVQGAQEMIIFVLVGLGAALLIVFADPKGIITRGTLIVLGALVGGAALYAILTALSWGWVLGLIGLASILALLAIGIGFATGQRLLPLLVSVFVASFLFSASCAFLIVEQQRYAQAIAIQFGPKAKAEKGITGIYITATEKTIFFARSDLAGADDAGLYEVPRAETTTYAVGRLEPIVEDDTSPVQESAKALLESLKVDAESFPPPPAAASTKDSPAIVK